MAHADRKGGRVFCDPVKAKQISDHTTEVLRQIRACDRLEHLDMIVAGYDQYAKSMSVVAAIKAHVREAVEETAINIKARTTSPRVVRDPTGERHQ
jgi:pyridoxal/pyridoxine/pyridoxamine kinase